MDVMSVWCIKDFFVRYVSSGCSLKIKMSFYQLWNSYHNENPHTWEDGLYTETNPWHIADMLLFERNSSFQAL